MAKGMPERKPHQRGSSIKGSRLTGEQVATGVTPSLRLPPATGNGKGSRPPKRKKPERLPSRKGAQPSPTPHGSGERRRCRQQFCSCRA